MPEATASGDNNENTSIHNKNTQLLASIYNIIEVIKITESTQHASELISNLEIIAELVELNPNVLHNFPDN